MFREKIKEAVTSVLPITFIVGLLAIFYMEIESALLINFFIGACLIILGLAFFLWGAELGIARIGEHMGKMVAKFDRNYQVFFFGLFLGFIITIAEPDLLILAKQIEAASNAALNSATVVWAVAAGVGLLVGLGFLRILKEIKFRHFMLCAYACVFVLLFFTQEAFHGISFDASGATTGAMTTPFLLALALGVSRLKGSTRSEVDSFGLVGVASVGPILAVLLLGSRLPRLAGSDIVLSDDNETLFEILFHSLSETAMALLPIVLLFAVLQLFVFRLSKRELAKIVHGLIFTYIGLVIFLTGVNAGFMDVARLLGIALVAKNKLFVLLLGAVFGMVVVLAEPAVYLLGDQVEDVTGGHIRKRVILLALSAGVGLAVALAVLKIFVPGLKLWMILSVGYALCLLLSYRISPLFAGIAFDSGGVASGPMTTTFLLAFTQGVASQIAGADLLIDGFGLIALVAMLPILMLSLVGFLFKCRQVRKTASKRTVKVQDKAEITEQSDDCSVKPCN